MQIVTGTLPAAEPAPFIRTFVSVNSPQWLTNYDGESIQTRDQFRSSFLKVNPTPEGIISGVTLQLSDNNAIVFSTASWFCH